MSTLIASFVILLLVVIGMAIGVIFGREPIKGTCGGLANAGVDGACDVCGGDTTVCEEQSSR